MKDEPLYRNGITHAQATQFIDEIQSAMQRLEDVIQQTNKVATLSDKDIDAILYAELTRIASDRE